MGEQAASEPVIQRRRSTRIARSIPVTVRGVDLLSQPFEERTATLAFNTFGCKYPSKHHLPKNTWVTLEIPHLEHAAGPNRVRARVVWIQRPRSVREMFQIAVEIETPGNVWGVEAPPEDWALSATKATPPPSSERSTADAVSAWLRANTSSRLENQETQTFETEMEDPLNEAVDKNVVTTGAEEIQAGNAEAFGFGGTVVPEAAEPGSMESPLVRELRQQIETQAVKATEDAIAHASEALKQTAESFEKEHKASAEAFFREWREDIDRDRDAAREEVTKRASEQMANVQDEIAARVTGQMSWVREELRSDLKQEFGSYIDQMRALVTDLERGAEAVRKEADAATASGDRLAQIKIALDAAEAAVDQRMRKLKDAAQETVALEDLSKAWRQKLDEQTKQARGEWDELLQTSLDGAAGRLATHLADSSQSALQSAEGRLSERFAQISEPVASAVNDAQQALAGIRLSLDSELQRARASLVDIESAAERMRELSAHIDAASHDAVNQLNRRLDAALKSQVNELRRNADVLSADLPQRIQPALDAAGQQVVSKILADLDVRLGPHLERIPELVRELTAHEVQAEEGLRLHRERLRQAAENSRRDAEGQMAGMVSELHAGFETARTEALARWNQELESSGARATHAAIENLVKNAEWHQKQAQEYIETLSQESLAKANGVFETKTEEALARLGEQLSQRNATFAEEAKQRLEETSKGLVEQRQGEIAEAANAAAGQFAEKVNEICESATRKFHETNEAWAADRTSEIGRAAESIRMTFEHGAGVLLERYRTEMAAYGEQKFSEAREFHSRELAASVEAARMERDSQAREWYERLARANEESLQKYEDQLHGASELWVNVAVDKLNDSGEATLAALSRAGETALRNSLLSVLEQITDTVRQSVGEQPASGSTPPRPTLVNPSGQQRESRGA